MSRSTTPDHAATTWIARAPHRFHRLARLLLAALLAAGCGGDPDGDSDDDSRASAKGEQQAAASGSPETGAATESAKMPPVYARERVFARPERLRPRLSPDGEQVSFLARVDGVLNLWVGPANDPAAAQPVTEDRGRGIRRYRWAYDGRHIVFLQHHPKGGGWHAHAMDLDSGQNRDLTPISEVRAELLALSPRHPQRVLIGLNARDPAYHDVYAVSLADGERELVVRNPGFSAFVADRDLHVPVALRTNDDGGWTVLTRDTAGQWQPLDRIAKADALTTQPVGFDAEGARLFWIDSRERDTAAVVAQDLDSGGRRTLFASDRADVERVIMGRDPAEPVAAAVTFARRQWHALDKSVAGDLAHLAERLDGELDIVDRSVEGRYWLIAERRAGGATLYYRYEREAGGEDARLKGLFADRPALDELHLADMHPRVIEARDGLKLVSYLSLPAASDPDGDGRPDEPLPLVVLVHDGPWQRARWGYDARHQWLANRGYAVLSVNFRGSRGFGKGFVSAGDREWGRAMQRDLVDAVDWAVSHDIAREDAVAIMGEGYGGYATVAGLAFTPDTYQCGAALSAPVDLRATLESFPPHWGQTLALWAERVGDPRTEEGRALLDARSPAQHPEAIAAPLWLAQGAGDPHANVDQARALAETLNERNAPVTFGVFPNEGHRVSARPNRLAFFAIGEALFAECLGGRREPFGGVLAEAVLDVPIGKERVRGLDAALERRAPDGG